ncbi:MAG: SulP family inorganic anion transporter [Anaerolineales bacterium]|nr:SulP family inorganic anion transporter [Anaerolineales bacterium]
MSGILQNVIELKPKKQFLAEDATTGITFALVNIPQAMANALLAGVNPVLGLYTLMVGTPVGAIFTGSVFMNVSTTSALSVAAGDALASLPPSTRAANMAVLVLLVGVVQLLAGVFRLGSFMRFVAKSVMVGFTTGVALLIILGQVSDLTGYNSSFKGKILQVADTLVHLGQVDYPTLFIGLGTIALIIGFNFTRARKFGFILAILVATAVTQLLNLESVQLVGDIAQLSGSLANFELPNIILIPNLFTSAVAIAIIGLVQGAGVSQSYPNPDGKYPNVSRDFTGQGIANVATSFLQGIPAGGSMSGTALVVNTGMRSRWGNIFAGLFVIPLIIFLGGLVDLIPMPTLAGLLIVVGYQSLNFNEVQRVWLTGQIPRVAMGLTLAATLTLPLQFAVFIGVAVSILLYVFQSSNQVKLVQMQRVPGGFPIEVPVVPELHDCEVAILHAYGSLFFAAASKIENQLPHVGDSRHAVVILRLRGRDDIGSTMMGVLERYHHKLIGQDGRLLLVGVEENVYQQLQRTGLLAKLGEENVFRTQPQIGVSVNQALNVAQTWLEEVGEDCQ